MKLLSALGVLALLGGAGALTAAATKQPTGYKERVLALNFAPTSTWTGETIGLGPQPALGHIIAELSSLGVKVRVLGYNVRDDLLTIDVDMEGTDGFTLGREVKIKPLQPFTFSNGTCAGYVFWHREENVVPAGYAVLQIRGFCP